MLQSANCNFLYLIGWYDFYYTLLQISLYYPQDNSQNQIFIPYNVLVGWVTQSV
jgi:hypothetical protein